ncbi:hypothetical protein GXW83_08970 [Streptacidiphilus sp. PB12-B1b]|uniref:hypothetical protein n=1 Tax=Streptacidiphilus sp. PB12-B1b TaxID=2705012 RepID=UPI0015F9E7FC|nr:hypothetical protein [Streptacidiphilus sp. PB12-B1b]QMU75851.1 hypothetical protein GXW83_08970 [Streptacidiphilus sp. PB12-B1b]
MQMDSRKQNRASTRRLVTTAVVAALTVGGAAACQSGTASAKPSATPVSSMSGGAPSTPVSVPPSSTPGASGSPSIQPGGTMIPGPPTAGQSFKGLGYTSNGDILTVRFFAGVCEKYGLHADQSTPGKVLTTIVVTQHPTAGQRCPMVITQQQVSTDLGSPLDGRAVVDTSSDKPLPQLDAPSGTKYYSPGPVKAGG